MSLLLCWYTLCILSMFSNILLKTTRATSSKDCMTTFCVYLPSLWLSMITIHPSIFVDIYRPCGFVHFYMGTHSGLDTLGANNNLKINIFNFFKDSLPISAGAPHLGTFTFIFCIAEFFSLQVDTFYWTVSSTVSWNQFSSSQRPWKPLLCYIENATYWLSVIQKRFDDISSTVLVCISWSSFLSIWSYLKSLSNVK